MQRRSFFKSVLAMAGLTAAGLAASGVAKAAIAKNKQKVVYRIAQLQGDGYVYLRP